jgi:hypothetical protein
MDAKRFPVVLNYDEQTLLLVTLANEIGIESAIAILEAAKGVDRERALEVLDDEIRYHAFEVGRVAPLRKIRALIETLPRKT